MLDEAADYREKRKNNTTQKIGFFLCVELSGNFFGQTDESEKF